MVDVLESEQGFRDRSIVVHERSPDTRGTKENARKIWVCENFSGHRERQRISRDRPGKCPECGRPLIEEEMILPY